MGQGCAGPGAAHGLADALQVSPALSSEEMGALVASRMGRGAGDITHHTAKRNDSTRAGFQTVEGDIGGFFSGPFGLIGFGDLGRHVPILADQARERGDFRGKRVACQWIGQAIGRVQPGQARGDRVAFEIDIL